MDFSHKRKKLKKEEVLDTLKYTGAVLGIFSEKIKNKKDEELQGNPNLTNWIMAIDRDGYLKVIDHPLLHWSYFEEGLEAEYLGLPIEVDEKPGLYSVRCSKFIGRDRESGIIDEWGFDIDEMIPLWRLT